MNETVQTFKDHLKGLIHALFPANPWFILLFNSDPSRYTHKVFLSYPFEPDYITAKMASYLVPKLPYASTKPVCRRDVKANLTETTVFVTQDITAPLLYQGRRIGLFWIGTQEQQGFSTEQQASVVQLAALIGFMMGMVAHSPRQAEEQIHSEWRFRDLIEHLNEAIFITDSQILVYVNSAFCSLVFAGEQQVIGTPLTRWIHPDDREAFLLRIRQFMAGDPLPENYEIRLKGETGENRLCLFNLRRIRDTRKDLYAGTLRDITNLKDIWERLFQAQKMNALSTLSGGIAHDFNNILGGILGYTSLIKAELSPDERSYQYVTAIEKSSNRAAKMIQQLLGFTSGGRYQEIPFVLQGTLQWLKELASGLFGESIKLVLEMSHEPLMVLGDMDQIRQASLNVCLNARDAMPRGGMLKIGLSKRHIPPRKYFLEQAHFPGMYAEMRFQDTGVGMDEAVLEKIFEPFFTTKEVGKGIGLGLSMTYGIIKGHGGFIEVESTPGKGSIFRICLPLYTPPGENAPHENLRDISGKEERILVVDDDCELRDLIKIALEEKGYQVSEAGNGLEAIKIFRQQPRPFDLVILDMVMPIMGGEETFWKLKRINSEARILLMTGFAIDGTIRNLLQSNALGYIHKPFHRNELLRAVRTCLDLNP